MRAALFALAIAALPMAAIAGEKAAPAFALKDINGKNVDLADKLGKDVIFLNFFATWCAPCQAELPILQRFHEKYAEKGFSVVVVSIDDPKSAAKVKPLIKEHKYTFTVLLDTQTRAISLYNPKKVVPFSVVIDRAGNIHQQKFGFQPGDEEKLEKTIVELLGTDAGKDAAVPAPADAPATN